MTREAFFEETANKLKIGTLKLRASWGQLGNTNTNEAWYPFYQTLPQGQNYGWLVNGVRQNYASNPGIVSSEKTWETIETWDVGLDWVNSAINTLTAKYPISSDYATKVVPIITVGEVLYRDRTDHIRPHGVDIARRHDRRPGLR